MNDFKNLWEFTSKTNPWEVGGGLSVLDREEDKLLSKLFTSYDLSQQAPNEDGYADKIYAKFKQIFEKISGVQAPELPSGKTMLADWKFLFSVWFFELSPALEHTYWVGDLIYFNVESPYCIDIVNSPSFSDGSNKNCVKNKFFKYNDKDRPNPIVCSFGFVGQDSGRKNYFTWVEWYLGSYRTEIHWMKKNDGTYEIWASISNNSTWHSGTRLPASWTKQVKEKTGVEILDLVTNAPRGLAIRRKLPKKIIDILEKIGNRRIPLTNNTINQYLIIPSFGGDFSQSFKLHTHWTK